MGGCARGAAHDAVRRAGRIASVAALGARAALGAAAVLAGLWTLAAAPARGAERTFEGPIEVVGDEVEYEAEREVYVARGHVVITQEGRRLTADRVLLSERTGIGIATGRVVMTDDEDVMRADFVQFDIESDTGVVFRGRLESASSHFEMRGEEVRRTGEDTYSFRDGRFTTCRCPDPEDRDPWTLTAGSADLRVEGYAVARNATLEVLDVPVLWSPFVIYPIKTERQTGFLFPEVGNSARNGFEAALPFFWAPREDFGLLLRPEYQTTRGFKPGADADYVFGERGAGRLYGTFIHDREIDSDSPRTPFDPKRWGASWTHVQDTPLDGWLAVDALGVSDNDFPFDFRDFEVYRRDRFLHSRALVGSWLGPTDRFGLQVATLYSNDLQNPDDQDRDDVLLQRLPELRFAALPAFVPASLPGPLERLVASGGFQYTSFRPRGDPSDVFDSEVEAAPDRLVDGLFYDTGRDAIFTGDERDTNGNKVPFDAHGDDGLDEGNRVFDEGEPLADEGHRLVATPRLEMPVRVADLVELTPEVGYYGTTWSTDEVGTEHRSQLIGRLDARSQARGDVDLPLLGKARHLVEPHAQWVLLTDGSDEDDPLFVPETATPQDRLRQLDVDSQLWDPSDRLDRVHSLVFGVTNRLLDDRFSLVRAELDVSSEYRLEEGEWGPLVAQGVAQLPARLRLRGHVAYALQDLHVAEGLADLGWFHPKGHSAGLRYRYIRDIPRIFEAFLPRDPRFNEFKSDFLSVNQIGGGARVQITRQWAMDYAGSFSFENAFSLVNLFGLEYLSRCACWAVRLEVEEDRVRGLQWSLRYRLLGLGDDRARPFQGPRGDGRVDGLGGL